MHACVLIVGSIRCLTYAMEWNQFLSYMQWNVSNISQPKASLPLLHCHQLRMQRFASQAKKGKVKCNPEILKLWGSEPGRTMANFTEHVIP